MYKYNTGAGNWEELGPLPEEIAHYSIVIAIKPTISVFDDPGTNPNGDERIPLTTGLKPL